MTDDLPARGSEEYNRLWTDDPRRISRTLTPAERCDPQLNPMHPFADSNPPGTRLKSTLLNQSNPWRIF